MDELKTRLRKIGESGIPFDIKLPEGICDYALYRENGEVLAVVEVKRTSVAPRLAQAQTQFYVEQIEKLPEQGFRPCTKIALRQPRESESPACALLIRHAPRELRHKISLNMA